MIVLTACFEQEELKSCRIKIVDFHAEATAEKRALGFYLDGRVSALFGTHTHVQTADEQILPQGTGYLTDLGMTGEIQSVLGVRPELAIEKMRTGMPVRFENGDGPCMMCGCIFEIDEHSAKQPKFNAFAFNKSRSKSSKRTLGVLSSENDARKEWSS